MVNAKQHAVARCDVGCGDDGGSFELHHFALRGKGKTAKCIVAL